jgi:hypothetical protein
MINSFVLSSDSVRAVSISPASQSCGKIIEQTGAQKQSTLFALPRGVAAGRQWLIHAI